MRKILAIVGLALLALSGPAMATVAQYQVRGVKAGDSLNLRATPSPKAKIVGRIPASARGIEIIARGRGTWVQVSYGRAKGFVNRQFLALSTRRATGVTTGAPKPAAVTVQPAALDVPAAPQVAPPAKLAPPTPPATPLPGQGPEDRSATPELMKPPSELMPEAVPATPPK